MVVRENSPRHGFKNHTLNRTAFTTSLASTDFRSDCCSPLVPPTSLNFESNSSSVVACKVDSSGKNEDLIGNEDDLPGAIPRNQDAPLPEYVSSRLRNGQVERQAISTEGERQKADAMGSEQEAWSRDRDRVRPGGPVQVAKASAFKQSCP
jgi:hypothetical protein